MASRRRVVSILAVLALLPGAGCSWIFVNKPPPEPIPVTPPLACTTSVASPVVDTILAATALGLGIGGIVSGTRPEPPCTSGTWCMSGLFSGLNTGIAVTGGVLVATAIPLAFSAAHGYSATAECRELKESQLACISGVEASCRRLTVDPGSPQVGSPDAPQNVGAPCTSNGDCTGGARCDPVPGSQSRCVGR